MTELHSEISYTVPRMSCSSCRALVTEELEELASVDSVEVNLDTKSVVVRGAKLDDVEIRSALRDAGYEAQSV